MNRYSLHPQATIIILTIVSLFLITASLNTIPNNQSTNRNLQLLHRINADFTLKEYQQEVNEKYYEEAITNAIMSKRIYKDVQIKWENVVIMIITHNHINSNELVEAQFHTWINRLGDKGIGLDIVFVTDKWDLRDKEQILPHANKVTPNIHLYKSSAPFQGSKCRDKVLDGFTYLVELFKTNYNKHYFIKMDPDNFILAENVIQYLNHLKKVHPNPVDFGRYICAGTGDFCFSEGGFYGMDRLGLLLSLNYIKTHGDIYEYDDNGKDSIEHEDFFMSYAFFRATGYSAVEGTPIIFPQDVKSCETNALSIHPIKSAANIYDYARFCYDENGNVKEGVDLGTQDY